MFDTVMLRLGIMLQGTRNVAEGLVAPFRCLLAECSQLYHVSFVRNRNNVVFALFILLGDSEFSLIDARDPPAPCC